MAKKSLQSQIIRHKFNGTTYLVDTEPFQAACDSPDPNRTPSMLFASGITEDKNCLCNVVHECIHASNWDLPEETVHRMGKEIGCLLWKLGYRLKTE
jgi:hypothetical protein